MKFLLYVTTMLMVGIPDTKPMIRAHAVQNSCCRTLYVTKIRWRMRFIPNSRKCGGWASCNLGLSLAVLVLSFTLSGLLLDLCNYFLQLQCQPWDLQLLRSVVEVQGGHCGWRCIQALIFCQCFRKIYYLVRLSILKRVKAPEHIILEPESLGCENSKGVEDELLEFIAKMKFSEWQSGWGLKRRNWKVIWSEMRGADGQESMSYSIFRKRKSWIWN